MSRVYWIKGRSTNIQKSITSKVATILSFEELAKVVVPNQSLALKVNVSELGYGHSLPPIAVNTFFEQAREMGASALVTDTGSLCKGPRFDGHGWQDTAIMQGFGIGDALDNQMMLTGGFTNEEGRFCPSDGEHLGGVELGSLILDVSNLVVFSHVTAHPLIGMVGAVYNLGMGLLTRAGKSRVHSCLEVQFDENKCTGSKVCLAYCPTGAVCDAGAKVSFDKRICNGCLGCFMSCPSGAMSIKPEGIVEFQESVVEAAAVVAKNLRGNAFYVNFLTSVTPQSDEYPFSDIPFIPDLGILASEDPVALDWVSYQMTVRSPGIPGSIAEDLKVLDKGSDKILAITGNSPAHLLEYAESMMLGKRDCEFLISG
ncbi:putative Uncharacterized Fe-S center protein [Syntrophobacter sp. SbD1]|nr:putative Uncharacterized Fe-S center protein [Syntrophobacter sp. SbD1]